MHLVSEASASTFGNGEAIRAYAMKLGNRTPTQINDEIAPGFLFLSVFDLDARSTDESQTMSVPGDLEGAGSADIMLVFPLVRKPTSTFEFVAVGRNSGNDIHLPHPTISRFHAYFKLTEDGVFLQDARSTHGTTVCRSAVPRQGEGDAREVKPGDPIQFGSVRLAYADATGLLAVARDLA